MDAAVIRTALDRMRKPGPPRMEVLTGSPDQPGTVGLVAGSFDPMTVAHVALAEALGTHVTLFVYSPATLPKEAGPGGEVTEPLLDPEDRVASLLAYCRGHQELGVALCSHGRYADQAPAAAQTFPGSRLTFGMGSDKLVQLVDPGWYEDRDAALDRLFARAEVAYAPRPDEDERLAGALAVLEPWQPRLRLLSLPADVAGISARSVREAVRDGRDVGAHVPPDVLPFLAGS